MSKKNIIYLSLGSNLGDRAFYLNQALQKIAQISHIENFRVSEWYETSPVSDIPQDDFLNAICRFKTDLPPSTLFRSLQAIENTIGKTPSSIKNAPRKIDIDMIFYGTKSFQLQIQSQSLEIPHPRWKERLFVIVPLLDLTHKITLFHKQSGKEIINLIKLKDSLLNKSQIIKPYGKDASNSG